MDCPPTGYWSLWATAYEAARVQGGFSEECACRPDGPRDNIRVAIVASTLRDTLPALICALQADPRDVPTAPAARGWVPGRKMFDLSATTWQTISLPTLDLLCGRLEAVVEHEGSTVLPLLAPATAARFIAKITVPPALAEKRKPGRPVKEEHALVASRLRPEIAAELAASSSGKLAYGRAAHFERRFLDLAMGLNCEPSEDTPKRLVRKIILELTEQAAAKGL